MFAPFARVIVVCVGPAPRNTTWPLLEKIELLMLNDPAGTRTTELFGAELRAELILEVVTVPLNNVLQAVVTQLAHVPLGIPPGIPAFVQSIARLELRMPDQAWPTQVPGTKQSRNVRTAVRSERRRAKLSSEDE
jgi:hypothetical protein